MLCDVSVTDYTLPLSKAKQGLAFETHNTFWLFGHVPQPKVNVSCNCAEEFDIWETGGVNYHFTGPHSSSNPYYSNPEHCSPLHRR